MVTIGDVARRAGVARSTVSHALSGKRPVNAATRERILAVIAELDYHPNATASNLRSRRTRTVGLAIPLD
ncbi:MAG TPA: LacI family DNA-binding transcriptional regulator, partial [Chloroflexota bacterium]|nr:LacI family DNA-binding transcriptional regulator [Chloroflexota bacterium]